jgi:hypothetical protein
VCSLKGSQQQQQHNKLYHFHHSIPLAFNICVTLLENNVHFIPAVMYLATSNIGFRFANKLIHSCIQSSLSSFSWFNVDRMYFSITYRVWQGSPVGFYRHTLRKLSYRGILFFLIFVLRGNAIITSTKTADECTLELLE